MFAALGFPVGGATGVLYARRSADGIFVGGRIESGLAQFANLFALIRGSKTQHIESGRVSNFPLDA